MIDRPRGVNRHRILPLVLVSMAITGLLLTLAHSGDATCPTPTLVNDDNAYSNFQSCGSKSCPTRLVIVDRMVCLGTGNNRDCSMAGTAYGEEYALEGCVSFFLPCSYEIVDELGLGSALSAVSSGPCPS